MDENKNIDDLVAFLDGSVGKGVGHINVDTDDKIEEAVIKIEEYRGKLSKEIVKQLDYKNRCLNKVERIQTGTLRAILIYYYFQNKTLEQTAEEIDRSYRWTYDMFTSALDEYAKIE